MKSISRTTSAPSRPALLRRLRALALLLSVYFVLAYLCLPGAWRMGTHLHPALEESPRITRTRSGIHGDPLNVALIGSEEDVVRALMKAGWFPADRITWRSSLHIIGSTLF